MQINLKIYTYILFKCTTKLKNNNCLVKREANEIQLLPNLWRHFYSITQCYTNFVLKNSIVICDRSHHGDKNV